MVNGPFFENIQKEHKISKFLEKVVEKDLPEIFQEQTNKILDESKKMVDFFFKHLF